MVRDLLIRGMLAGLIAGLLAFGVAKIVGEPEVDRAIAFEEQVAATHEQAQAQPGAHQHEHGGEEDALVSREMQSTLGLFTAVIVYGTAMGGLFALAFASLWGRAGALSPRALAALLAVAGFAAVYFVPSLKYPANPPAVGASDTIGLRTGLFFLMILVSLGALTLATAAARRLAARFGGWNAALLGAGIFIAIVGLAQLLLPDVNEVPTEFPAQVLWNFRLASIGMQALMWGALGLIFGALAERGLSVPARARALRSA
jgi:predicted cobalt transporter CbtA